MTTSCDQCGAELHHGDWPFCPHGRGCSGAIDDSMDHVQINGCKEPIHFTSKQERKRWLKENGYREYVRHIGVDGSDKSKHTTRWATMDAYTLANAKELLERAAQQPARNDPAPDPLPPVRTYAGDIGGKEWNAFHGHR